LAEEEPACGGAFGLEVPNSLQLLADELIE